MILFRKIYWKKLIVNLLYCLDYEYDYEYDYVYDYDHDNIYEYGWQWLWLKQNILLIKIEETKPSAPLLYPNNSSSSEQIINEKNLIKI